MPKISGLFSAICCQAIKQCVNLKSSEYFHGSKACNHACLWIQIGGQ